MKYVHLATTAAATLAMGLSTPLLADSTSVEELERRITELEARPKLSFGVGGVDIKFYGYIKADFIADFDSDLGTTAFGLGSIVPGAPTGSNFRGQAIQSRFGVVASLGDSKGVLEGDFFGNGGGDFRLRQAYVQTGNFTLGQTWTNFMPIESYPSTLDFQGPSGIPFARVVQARYTYDTGNGLGFSASVERSAASSSEPAFTGAVFYQGSNYFLKLAGIRTTINTGGTDVTGTGFNVSGNAQLWEGGSINASYTSGSGIGSYLVFGGADTFGGSAVDTTGLTIGLSQKVNDWTFAAAYGLRDIDQGAATDTSSLETVHLTVTNQIRENTTLGLEYITGERELFNGTSARADRLQASIQFNF